MKLGAHCVLYGPEIAENTDAVISRLADVGAEGCELGERFFGTDKREQLVSVLEKYHIPLAGMHSDGIDLIQTINAPEKTYAALEKVALFVEPLPYKNLITTGMPGAFDSIRERTLGQGAEQPELHDPEQIKKLAKNLNEIAKELKSKYGVQVNYHNHSWEFCDNGLIWFGLVDNAPDLHFALDTGWAAVSGFDPVGLLERCRGRVHYVHLRDYKKVGDPNQRAFNEVYAGFVNLGTGDMNYPRLMRKLNEVLLPEDWAIVEYEIGNFDKNSYQRALSYLHGVRDML